MVAPISLNSWHNLLGTSNTLRPEQNGGYSVKNIFKFIFLIEKFLILSQTSLRFLPWGPIYSKAALVKVRVWCCQVTSHSLNQCRLRTTMQYGNAGTQWVKLWSAGLAYIWVGINQSGLFFFLNVSISKMLFIIMLKALKNNKSLLRETRLGDKPLLGPMMTQFSNTHKCLCHQATMS